MAREAEWTSKRQGPMSVQSEGGKSRKWQRVVELLRETEGRSRGNPNEAQLPTKPSSQPLQPTASRKGRNAFFTWGSKLSSWIWRTCSPNLQRTWLQKAIAQATQNPHVKSWLVAQPASFEFGLSWEESGNNNLPLGPKNLSSLWRKQQSTHPLGEEIKTRFLCLSLRFKSLELKYLSFALRTTGSLTRSLIGWFRPHVSGGVARGFQTVFSRHDARIPPISRSSWDSFSSLKYLSYHRAQLQKKVIETIKHDQHWIFNSMSFDVSAKAFPCFNLLKAGVVDVPPCFMTRCLFLKHSVHA